MSSILKTGSSSIILGEKYYKSHFPVKQNKLLKVTKIMNNHNEFKFLQKIRTIENYQDYYSIPDEEKILLKKGSVFFNKLKLLVLYDKMSIFDNNLHIMYIDYAGQIDVLDSLNYLTNGESCIWKNHSSILDFTKQMVVALKYLHDKKLCHLDIKPENIMISVKNRKNIFKLIDFGFCCQEPFDNFVNYYSGTPGYYPCHFHSIEYIQPGLPRIYAKDMDYINGNIRMYLNRSLVYKIDSYCLGRVINYVYYTFTENSQQTCCVWFDYEYRKRQKIDKIIELLLEKCPNKRITINQLFSMNILW